MIRAKDWDGKDLKGTWEVTLKIDGVRALWDIDAGGWVSRAGKPLYNIPLPSFTPRPNMQPDAATPNDIEVYHHDSNDQKVNFKNTIRATRSKTIKAQDGCGLKRCKCEHLERDEPHKAAGCPNWEVATPTIRPEHLYSLDPLDPRLGMRSYLGHILLGSPKAAHIVSMMEEANRRGYEGLVLRRGDTWLKVKPKPTWDVLIKDVIEGVGKRKGHVGAFMTSKGKVGGFRGFSYAHLKALWDNHCNCVNFPESGYEPLIGQTIEVEAMGLTQDGKFRQPRCIRFRPDKVAEE